MSGLPLLPGPKLQPFRFRTKVPNIEFVEELGEGKDSTVWKVSIDDSIYALKIFGFGHVLNYPLSDFYEGKDEYTPEDIRTYEDPFHCECRAYGRLKETGKEHLSIACYGYVMLSSDHEKELLDKGGMTSTIDRWHEEFENLPLRAIVKEFIEEPDEYWHLDPKKIPRMIRDVDTLHQIGIFVNDISAENWLNDVIMDFSRARTVPHPYYNRDYIEWLTKGGRGWDSTARRDEKDFDSMIDTWNYFVEVGTYKGEHVWHRMQNNESRYKLRSGRRFNEAPR
ncbi:kinetochore Sim4 complex subunit FTA2-domain-containing protein [Whalleya microplaca]|nr:kinetochore Sim4 complex subunit FTA2-domain-containing protein [Whalleya microplaca]